MAGFAGVHPVESFSFIMVFWVVAAHPLLCMVSVDSNTPSVAVIFGVSLVISSIVGVVRVTFQFVAVMSPMLVVVRL